MSMIEIGKRKNLTHMVMNLTRKHFENETKPLTITNAQLPLITESAYIIQELEKNGYKVATFTDGTVHGIKITKH